MNFNSTFIGLLGIFLIYVLGIAYSITPIRGYNEIHLIAILVLFSFIFSLFFLENKHINLLLCLFVRFITLYCIYISCCYIAAIPMIGVESLTNIFLTAKRTYPFLLVYPSFSHPSFISIIIIMAIPIAAYLKKERRISWIELLFSIMLVIIVVMITGARIGLVIVPILLLFCLLFILSVPRYINYITIISSCILVLILLKTSSINEKFKDTIRRDQSKTAIAALKEKPLFGWGTGSMEALLYSEDIAQKAGLEKPIAEFNHFHNQYLDMLVQFGIIGSLPFFALFIYLIYLTIKRKDFLLMAYLAIYLPFMFVESPFATAKGIQPMIFWLCFLISTQKIRLEKISNSSNDDKSELGAENT